MSAPAKVNGWIAEPLINGHTHMNGYTDMNDKIINEDLHLYSPSLLEDLDLSTASVTFNPTLTMANPGYGLRVRPLNIADYDRGFLELLSQLTSVGEISHEEWEDRFINMKKCPDTYLVTVIEDTITNRVIGSATLVVEQKFIHNCAKRGALEDVVVSDAYRGKQLGKLIVAVITLLAQKVNCYKLSLNCKDSMIKFYSSLGYKLEEGNGNYMQIRMDH